MARDSMVNMYDPAADPEGIESTLSELGRLGTTRRNFIKGVIAVGATAGTGLLLTGCSPDESGGAARTVGAVERLITLNVNGTERRVDVLPQETLAQTLRYKLGLTGTKLGCDRGECGACSVLIDDVPVYSCSTLTHSVRAGRITTIEGIKGADGGLHPVQQAFIDELGPQCGFCTPGQVITAVALLNTNPSPSRAEVAQAMAGNLCRCGAYDHYLDAIMAAAETA